MKILVLTNLYPPHYLGGYELICQAVVNALRQRGHEIHVLTTNHLVAGKSAAPDEAGVERSLRINGFYGHPWLGIRDLRSLERHNNSVLKESIARIKPDLVYVWNLGGVSKSLVFTLQALGTPSVYYLSDHWIARGFKSDVWLQWWNNPKSSPQQKVVRKALTLCGYRRFWHDVAPTNPVAHLRFQRIYFCSRALRKLTASAGFDVMHGAVIYCPVNIHKFNGLPKSDKEPLTKWLWVGRLAEDKGVFTALKALALIKDKFPGSLHIYGHGEPAYVAKLKDFSRDNNLAVQFHSAGADQMPQVYRDHDALLFTSEWAEPFALTPLEAMASGLPVIGTLTGGSRELFRHKDNSLTYTAGNAEELSERILELSRDNQLRARIAATGNLEVRANYSEPAIVDQIETYLKETVRSWTAAPLPLYSE